MPQTLLPHLAARILGTPLMVDRARLETILSVIGPRIGLEPAAMPHGFEEKSNGSNLMVTPNGIAIVPIHGTLVKRAGAIEAASGLTSYAAIEDRILDAATDPGVRAILLDIDSPGGEVGGVFDLAAMIREAGQDKPIWALADDAFSAAYLIATTAHHIIVPQTAGVGSVGVIAVHVDESARDAQEGRAYTTVFAGARKNDFSSHAPLSDEARIGLQKEVDRLYGMFASAVATSRNMSEEAVRSTEAGLFFGDDAVQAGLADQVGTIRDAMAGLTTILDQPRTTQAARTRSAMKESEMPTNMESDLASQRKEAIDLEAIRSATRKQTLDYVAEVHDLCALAGSIHQASGFIAKGTPLADIRKSLLETRAQTDEATAIHHRHGPSLVQADQPVIDTQAIYAARNQPQP